MEHFGIYLTFCTLIWMIKIVFIRVYHLVNKIKEKTKKIRETKAKI